LIIHRTNRGRARVHIARGQLAATHYARQPEKQTITGLDSIVFIVEKHEAAGRQGSVGEHMVIWDAKASHFWRDGWDETNISVAGFQTEELPFLRRSQRETT
jgi:hypothetical protein